MAPSEVPGTGAAGVVVPAAVSSLSATLLAGEVRTGRVLAAYPFGVYLDVAGTVLPVLASDAVALPTAVRVTARAGGVEWGVSSGDRAEVGGGMIRLPGVSLRAVRTWRPSRVRVLTPAEAARTSASRGSCANHMQERVVRAAPSASRGSWSGGSGAPGWLVDGIRAAVTATDPGDDVRRLVGRGAGLTPAGDDALAGAVLVELALGRQPLLADAVRSRWSATTAVSQALLFAACDGYAAPQVVALVDAAVAGDGAGVTACLPAVLAIGHTSGRDLVTGLSAALAADPSSSRSAA